MHESQGTGSGKSNLKGFVTANDGWTLVNVNGYAGRRAVLELPSSPGYMRVMGYKAAASRMVALPASRGIVLPDVRVAVGVALSLVFPLVGWIRSDASVPRPSGPHDVTHDVVGQP